MATSNQIPATDAARFAAIVSCSTDAIISKSLDGKIETWNPAAETLFGWTAGEIVGQSITRIIPDELLDEEARIIESIRRGKTVPKFQTTRLAKDGTRIPIAVTVSPVRDSSGNGIWSVILRRGKYAGVIRKADDSALLRLVARTDRLARRCTVEAGTGRKSRV